MAHTRPGAAFAVSADDYPKRPEIISDQTLLALFADRAPLRIGLADANFGAQLAQTCVNRARGSQGQGSQGVMG